MPLPPRALVALFLTVVFSLGATASAQVVISEFMATNSNTSIVDEDGSHSDWIELQNNGTTTVNLNGWYLTDNATDLREWQFPVSTPAVNLAPGARLLVWASGKDRKLAVNRLHTNFKLDAAGEYLALVRPDGFTAEYSFDPKYPPQATDVSYGISGGRQWKTLAGPTNNTQWKVHVPQDATDYSGMSGWNTNTAFSDSTWATKMTYVDSAGFPRGIGYDSGGSTGGRAYLINYSNSPNGVVASAADVASATTGMYNTGTFTGVPNLCVRNTFTVTDPSTIQQLRLNARYDDGFIVYLNGTEVLRVNAPTTVAWNSAAPVDREDDQSEDWETFDLAGAQNYLVAGTNLLAIQGFNEAKNSGHFVITPSLEAFQTVSGATGGTLGYLATATPGGENTIATTAIGPDISQTTRNPAQPVGGVGSAPLYVTARVRPTLNPISSVTCRVILNFGSEISLTMKDDGANGDAIAGDSIFTVSVPTTSLQAGGLLRWRIVATDTSSVQATDPPFRDQYDNEQYFGTMAQAPGVKSQLPQLFWFYNTPNTTPTFATNKSGFRSSLYWILPGETSGRYYDNIHITIHGQSTSGFAKKSQNVNFNSDNRFKWRKGEDDVRSVNLLSNWADKTHVRNSLMWEMWGRTKHPSHWSQMVRVQQITAGNVSSGADAQFLGIWDMVEDANTEFLKRWGLDENGALYKCYNSLTETSQNSTTNGGGLEKKTREYEDFSDIATLVSKLSTSNSLTARRQYVYDNVNIPALVNYLAVHDVFMSHDFGHKNYYIYRDTNGTGEWTLMPWDQDLSFGHTWNSTASYFDDNIDSSRGLVIGGTGNSLMRLILVDNAVELVQMYCRRVKTLVDQYYGPPAAPQTVLEGRIAAYQDLIDPPAWPVTTDAERDFQKWGFWVQGSGSVIGWTDSRAADHRLRPMAARLTSSNPNPPYPSANPYAPVGATTIPPFIPGRRTLFYTGNPLLSGQPLPATQATAPNLVIESINYNPGAVGQDGEFFIIRNPNSVAIDLSNWTITGAVDYTFPAGTVIPALNTSTSDGGSSTYINQLVVARNSAAVRTRTASPKKNEYRLIVGGYNGRLSARGGTIELRNTDGTLVASSTYAGSPTAAQQSLRVTELNYAPLAPTAAETAALPGVQAGDFEYIELLNTGTQALDLSNAQFDRGITFTFPAGFSLAPGARTLVVSSQAAFTLRYGSGKPVAGQYEGNLDNSGEQIRLLDGVGEIVLDFTYNPGWYPPTAAGGYSLVSRSSSPDYSTYGAPNSWAISGQAGGTPGDADTSFSESFEGWRHDYFSLVEEANSQVAGVGADPESDGQTNFSEYAFGSHPRQPDPQGPTTTGKVTVSGTDYATISFVRRTRALDVNYTVEASSDLTNWQPLTTEATPATSVGTGLERATFRDTQPMGGGQRFLRVRAVKH